MAKKSSPPKSVETFRHDDATRKNIPTAELQPMLRQDDASPRLVKYPRNTDLDPQLVWRGKDEQDWSDLVVHAPPLYIQEKIHPKALLDDLLRQSKEAEPIVQFNLFNDFNGIPKGVDKTEFYQHDQNWSNRMILGDSLQVMASLAEREGLRGKVQCIYFDPPYGIKFNSNFQWSTTSRDVKDGNPGHITREPEQVKAFRDTWRDGIHSYLTYLRDRLTVARDLLTESGSIFVQIGDENVHRVRSVMDEVFGNENFVAMISFQKTGSLAGNFLSGTVDYIIWYAKNKINLKYRQLYKEREAGTSSLDRYDYVETTDGTLIRISAKAMRGEEKFPVGERCRFTTLLSDGVPSESKPFNFCGKSFPLRHGKHWKTDPTVGGKRLVFANRVVQQGETVWYKRFVNDFSVLPMDDRWESIQIGRELFYVVQTATEVVKRCLLMATDPGDLVLDPTCGSGTTATVAEQWGRRWITIDTSRVALALARARIMGARYPFYLLADSREGQLKEAEITRTAPSTHPVQGNIRHGFVYERVPHITLKSIANNAEIDVIWEKWQQTLEPLREKLKAAVGAVREPPLLQEWEIPREADAKWPDAAKKLHADWWAARIARQKEIDASIAAKAEFEFLYDKPYENKKAVRVAGPFTVESLSPHRSLGVDENDELIDPLAKNSGSHEAGQSFPQMVLENLKTAGVQQAHKEDRITFTALTLWPGKMICAEGRYLEGDTEKRAAIFIGPEFGTVQRADLVEAARECADAGFDALIACAFNYEAHSTEFSRLGRIPVLKARMNADLHMAEDLKNTGSGNLFVIFGEPDIELLPQPDGRLRVKVNGVDIFKPQTGEVISHGADGIACWLLDTDYNEESFFVRHAYFLGANDPYSALKTTLKAEINAEVWEMLKSDTSRPFEKPKSGRIAVKVINHLGDEVMKVFRVS
ncbi:site-specific DNA-methyltransferase [Candidatus Electronema sp. JC]|uniref:site-specific DNA-methyltransferase n=1 Tax=Candidatus Electronema sp. JC TaxID=3401570 RepID=UPI003B4279E1